MSDSPFDPTSIFESYRNAFAPVLKAQQEGVKAIERLGRYQYAVAGDYLEWSLAQATAATAVQDPRRIRVQAGRTRHRTQREAARSRARVRHSGDRAPASFTEVVNEAATKAADLSKEATAKVVETAKRAA